MAALNFSAFAPPLSPDEPCGPDLEGDGDFMNVVARLEVALPSSYFRRDDEGRQVAFDRTSIDFVVAFADLQRLLARSCDLRLLLLAAKLSILNRDLAGFAGSLAAIADGLGGYWEAIHPRADDGDFILRDVALQGLDDLPTVVFPLQHAPLIVTRRLGPLAFRSHLVAIGETRLVEGEQHPDTNTIQAALMDVELEALAGARSHVAMARDALVRISAVWTERAGPGASIDFPRLSALLGQIHGFLDGAIGRRPGQAASATGTDAASLQGSSAAAAPGACASLRDARNDLAGCLAYFRTSEPSSPAVLLIGQAQQLIGKSLLEVIQIMFPAHLDKAVIAVGGGGIQFHLPLERLAGLEASGGSWADEAAEDAAAEEMPAEEATGDDANDGAGAAEPGGDADAAPDGAAPAASPADRDEPAPVATRQDAIGRMKAVAAFYRRVEPSHPTPLLMDKACSFAQHDFLALLSDILPEVQIHPAEGS